MKNNFKLNKITEDQYNEFVELLNSELFDHLGFYKNARYTALKQNDDSSVYLMLKVDGLREKEHYTNLEQIEINMALLLNEFDCLQVSTEPVLDSRNVLLKKHISKLWRKFLLSQFKDEYEPMLSQYRETKRQELLENQQKEMQEFNDEYGCLQ